MRDYIGLGLLALLWVITIYIKFKPIFVKNGKYIIVSYIVRDRFYEAVYREFVVFNTKSFKFVKSSL